MPVSSRKLTRRGGHEKTCHRWPPYRIKPAVERRSVTSAAKPVCEVRSVQSSSRLGFHDPPRAVVHSAPAQPSLSRYRVGPNLERCTLPQQQRRGLLRTKSVRGLSRGFIHGRSEKKTPMTDIASYCAFTCSSCPFVFSQTHGPKARMKILWV